MTLCNPQEYQHPLIARYASKEMSHLFSDQKRCSTWRRLWFSLAYHCKALGLTTITDQALKEMSLFLDDIDFDLVKQEEARTRHDVMAHVRVFGYQCPSASKIIHLGATSCYVTDNADLIMIRDGLNELRLKLVQVMRLLSEFCDRYKGMPTLGFTHFQPAQWTTVGKRASVWLQDLWMDLDRWTMIQKDMKFRGVKGTTGTQASFLTLFEGNHPKVEQLDQMVTQAFGFKASYSVTGQTYPRKFDFELLSALSSFGMSVHKIATDLRLLAHLKEMEESFESEQVGSSAMAYKRNPMKSERLCALARHLMTLSMNACQTGAVQWLERSLDDSANRRIVIPEAFLTADSLLILLNSVLGGLIVNSHVIQRRIEQELPFMATESILMAMVNLGANRQECHEQLRKLSLAAAAQITEYGTSNPLLQWIQESHYFKPIQSRLKDLLDPMLFIGRAIQQVEHFLSQVEKVVQEYPMKQMEGVMI
jgi:adenylosuccinate lyase